MRVAILSDVHANAEALRAVLDDIGRRGAKATICLGDSVGYGAEPAECLELLFESCTSIIAGNHDLAAAGRLDLERFSTFARNSVIYAREHLTPALMRRMADLPQEDRFGELLLVHASPSHPHEFPYIRDVDLAREGFDGRPFRCAFYGHTHVPLSFHEDDGGEVTLSFASRIQLAQEGRYLCNVGSVGQPRDQDPRACYAIYDSDAREIRFHRIEYDVNSASAKIRAAGLPIQLATRLLAGV